MGTWSDKKAWLQHSSQYGFLELTQKCQEDIFCLLYGFRKYLSYLCLNLWYTHIVCEALQCKVSCTIACNWRGFFSLSHIPRLAVSTPYSKRLARLRMYDQSNGGGDKCHKAESMQSTVKVSRRGCTHRAETGETRAVSVSSCVAQLYGCRNTAGYSQLGGWCDKSICCSVVLVN